MSRYSTIYHTELPSKLLPEYDHFSKEYLDIQRYWRRECENYKNNPNHHFNPYRGMSSTNNDKFIQITEVIDKWKSGNPSRFHIVREIHKQHNIKYIEFVELYECIHCGVYCRTKNSYRMPSKIFNRFRGLVSKGEYNIKDNPLSLSVLTKQ